MALEKTNEELLASKINSRNYSAILPIIYNLKKKQNSGYVPSAPDRIIYTPGIVGNDSGTSKVFSTMSPSGGCAKGATLTLSGTATYKISTIGGGSTILKPAINIVAQIDVGIKNKNRNLIPFQVFAETINDDGTFTITIPASITSQLSVGTHYVYIDASSPDNFPVRLTVSGTPTDPLDPLYYTKSFTITV